MDFHELRWTDLERIALAQGSGCGNEVRGC